MRGFFTTSAATIVVAAAGIGLAGVASAAPTGTSSAADTVNDLRAQGHTVQVNGTRNGPLHNCSVNSVRGAEAGPGATVYVDLACITEYTD